MRRPFVIALATWIAAATLAVADSAPLRLELVAPGRAGSTEQAQPTMDALAAAVAAAVGRAPDGVVAHYTNELDAGLARLRDAPTRTLAFVPFELYLLEGESLGLEPLLAVADAHGALQRWTLVGKAGADGPSSIAGLPGYAPDVVRRVLLADREPPPATVEIRPARRLLSELRAAARDGGVAVLLDASQRTALDGLPFADELAALDESRPWPASLVCRVGDGLDEATVAELGDALLGLHETDAGRSVLEEMRLVRFAPLAEVAAAVELGRARMRDGR